MLRIGLLVILFVAIYIDSKQHLIFSGGIEGVKYRFAIQIETNDGDKERIEVVVQVQKSYLHRGMIV